APGAAVRQMVCHRQPAAGRGRSGRLPPDGSRAGDRGAVADHDRGGLPSRRRAGHGRRARAPVAHQRPPPTTRLPSRTGVDPMTCPTVPLLLFTLADAIARGGLPDPLKVEVTAASRVDIETSTHADLDRWANCLGVPVEARFSQPWTPPGD